MTLRHELADAELENFNILPAVNGEREKHRIGSGGSDPKISDLSTSPQSKSTQTQTIASSLPDHYFCYGTSLGSRVNNDVKMQDAFQEPFRTRNHHQESSVMGSSLPRDSFDAFPQSGSGIDIPNTHSFSSSDSGYHGPPGLKLSNPTLARNPPTVASSLPHNYSYFGSGNHMFNCFKTGSALSTTPEQSRGASTTGTLGPIGTSRPRSYSMSTSGHHNNASTSLFSAGDPMFRIFDNEPPLSLDRRGSGIFGSSDSPIFRNYNNHMPSDPADTVRDVVGSVLEDSFLEQVEHLILEPNEFPEARNFSGPTKMINDTTARNANGC